MLELQDAMESDGKMNKIGSILIAAALAAGCASAPSGPYADTLTIAYAPALGVDLTTAARTRNGMYYQDTSPGSGNPVTPSSQVRLHFTLFLPDGKQLQTTVGSEALVVKLDNPQFLIRSAIVGMRPGGKRTIVVAPAQGYGRAGVPGSVPPNATIVFHVELLGS